MDLNDLKKSISDCTEDELMQLIKGIRTSRRTPKATTTTKPKTAKTKTATPVSNEALLAGLSPEQVAILIKQLEGQG